jgi:hypothetical protein
MPQFDQHAKTHEYSPPASPSPSNLRGRVTLIEGSEHDGLQEGLPSLAQRLRMVCVVLLFCFAVFYGRSVLVEGFVGRLWWLWAFIFVDLGIASALLALWKPLTNRRLLLLEFMIYAGTAFYFTALMHASILHDIERNPQGTWMVFSVMLSITWSCVLAFSYAMMALESKRRAIVMMLLILGAPTAMAVYDWKTLPVFPQFVDGAMLSIIVPTSVLCWGALVYWIFRIDKLKKEAARARQFGHYRLKQLIGRGGMGEVYLAEHTLLKRPCALKRIRPGQDTDRTTLARFEREVCATAELSHPHTVEIYDYGRSSDGTFYYVMELLLGLTLDDLVHKHGPLSAARAVYLLRQVCDALEEAHTAGLIHRDIKPSNIYAARRGGEYDFVKLLDFGLVKGVARTDQPALSRAETIIGSPLYMSPEQTLNERIADVRGDIYSLGAVGYFLVVGHPPFVAENPLEIMISHARDAVPPPSQVVPDLPSDVEAILLKCLSKNPEERFGSSAALGEALAACSVADHWTRTDAARWWAEHQNSLVPGSATATDTGSFEIKTDLQLEASQRTQS